MQTNPLSNTASEAELKNLSPEEIALLTLWLNQIVVGEFRKFFVHMYFQYLVHCSDCHSKHNHFKHLHRNHCAFSISGFYARALHRLQKRQTKTQTPKSMKKKPGLFK
uniref:hypothetical protein n=1 Tax=Roseivirga sp. TaxID=1964215 RepID=UPI0040565549